MDKDLYTILPIREIFGMVRRVCRSGMRLLQALSGKDAQFDLGDIEPATVLGRVVQFEAFG